MVAVFNTFQLKLTKRFVFWYWSIAIETGKLSMGENLFMTSANARPSVVHPLTDCQGGTEENLQRRLGVVYEI